MIGPSEDAHDATDGPPTAAPETVEAWARAYIETTSLAHKLAPPPLPARWADDPRGERVPERPGRPACLRVVARAPKSPGPEALRDPSRRALLVHSFWHHELQAAELFCWAALAFPDAPRPLRAGWLALALDEIRHMGLYRAHLVALGSDVGAFPVRDWFWERVPAARTPAAFLALFGLGLEGGNLDHAQRFEARFRAVGDAPGAALIARVGDEEVPHVRFALRWLEALSGPLAFDAWTAALPPPLSPLVLRGAPLDRARRLRAGLDPAFVEALERWTPP